VVSFTLRPLYTRGTNLRYPLDNRMGGPRAGLDVVKKRKIIDPIGTRIRTPWSSSPLPLAIPTALSSLLIRKAE
jgi:hypothetical protein